MEKLKLVWTDLIPTPTTRWALGWLGFHLAAITLVALLPPVDTLPLLRLAASALAVALAYLLARRGWEQVAAILLCVMLTFDFHLSAIANYAAGMGYDVLVIASLLVVVTAARLLGWYGIMGSAGLGLLILIIGQARFAPDQYMAAVAYLALAIAIYLFFERREQVKDRGLIHRHDERADHVAIQLDTRRNGRLLVRLAKPYFKRLGLKRGDYIIIERGENQAEDGKQFIVALSIRKVDQDND